MTHCIADGLRELATGNYPGSLVSSPRSRRSYRWAVLLFPVALAWRIWRRRADFDAVVIHEPAGFWYGLMRRFARPASHP